MRGQKGASSLVTFTGMGNRYYRRRVIGRWNVVGVEFVDALFGMKQTGRCDLRQSVGIRMEGGKEMRGRDNTRWGAGKEGVANRGGGMSAGGLGGWGGRYLTWRSAVGEREEGRQQTK